MKNVFFLTLIVIAANSYSQVHLYCKAGGNAAFTNIRQHSSGIKRGIYAGAGIEINLHPRYGILTELLYSQKGGVDKQSSGSKLTTSLDYLTIPVLFYYKLTENLNIHAGPELAFLVKARANSGSNSMDIKNIYESFDKAVALGLGYSFGKFALDIRFVKGLNGLLSITTSDTYGNNYGTEKTGSNNTLQFGVHYTIF